MYLLIMHAEEDVVTVFWILGLLALLCIGLFLIFCAGLFIVWMWRFMNLFDAKVVDPVLRKAFEVEKKHREERKSQKNR